MILLQIKMLRSVFPPLLIFMLLHQVSTETSSHRNRLKYGESCSSETQCDSTALLKCNKGICGCLEPNTMTYNGTSCVVLAHQFCLPIDKLGLKEKQEYHKLPCVANAACTLHNPICNCLKGFYVGSDSTCKQKLYGTSCNSNLDCDTDANLVCKDRKHCDCKHNISIYDSISHQCLGTVGSPCDENGMGCSSNATCSNGRCSCRPDYQFLNKKGECEWKRGYNESCEENNQCDEEKFICNTKTKSCDCRSLQIYNVSSNTCVGLAGGLCFERKYPKESVPYRAECVANSECKGLPSNVIQCKCKDGYTPSSDGRCLIPHGGKCGAEEVCSEVEQGTVCFEGRCLCKTGQVFNKIRNKCVGQLHSRCNETTICVEDTHCAASEGGNDDLKQCACNKGLVPVDNNCHPTIGKECDYKLEWGEDNRKPSRVCDPLALSLHCINGICQCGNLEFYDKATKQCRGLVGSYCELESESYCTPNAECRLVRTQKLKRGMCKCKTGWKAGKDGSCAGDSQHGGGYYANVPRIYG
ncbi:unnamed protein product [Orchesella dallaii]|uniref:EGF-like domain-containing protein n=1 Tax=Orchesella dallaii TaxID=48710 RepID=A0ABP1PSK2_9HEXA